MMIIRGTFKTGWFRKTQKDGDILSNTYTKNESRSQGFSIKVEFTLKALNKIKVHNVNEVNSWYLEILISNYHNLAATSIKQKLEEIQGKHMNILKQGDSNHLITWQVKEIKNKQGYRTPEGYFNTVMCLKIGHTSFIKVLIEHSPQKTLLGYRGNHNKSPKEEIIWATYMNTVQWNWELTFLKRPFYKSETRISREKMITTTLHINIHRLQVKQCLGKTHGFNYFKAIK